jgi:hypothetical protein
MRAALMKPDALSTVVVLAPAWSSRLAMRARLDASRPDPEPLAVSPPGGTPGPAVEAKMSACGFRTTTTGGTGAGTPRAKRARESSTRCVSPVCMSQ